MFSSFLLWARQTEARLKTNGVVAHLTESEGSDNPSARLDIDTPTAVARITCWESGDFDAEVIDLDTEQTLYSTRGTFRDGCAIADHFSGFFEAIRAEQPSN